MLEAQVVFQVALCFNRTLCGLPLRMYVEWLFLELHCTHVTKAIAFEEGKRSEFAQLLEINLKHVWVPAPHSNTTNGSRPCLCCQPCLPNLHAY